MVTHSVVAILHRFSDVLVVVDLEGRKEIRLTLENIKSFDQKKYLHAFEEGLVCVSSQCPKAKEWSLVYFSTR